MNTKSIGSAEVRERFAEMLNEVNYAGKRFIVRRRGKPLAAIIPASEYQALIEMLTKSGISGEIHNVPVIIHFDGEHFFIRDEQFDLYGEGDTLEEARQDYWLALQDAFADLESEADRLAPYLAEKLTNLRKVVESESSMGKAE